MCGIAGIVNLVQGEPPRRADLERMIASLRHRGPDECGLYRDENAGLAHSRLSIIDLSTGQQPLGNADASRWIVFNGEIYNYLELREELVASGHVFRTHSDTEVVLHAWEEWGEEALRRFNGQWALAIWEPLVRRLVLARDRFGIRPLYFAEAGGRVVFGSEVKALFAGDASLPRAFDSVGLEQSFTFWAVVAPRSVFRGVSELEPAHLRIYEGGRAIDRQYWHCDHTPQFDGDLVEAAAAVRTALARASTLRMLRADVPVGCYLSGGLDSSLIAALASGVRQGESFQTFSLRFRDAEYDETYYQHRMVERLGCEHHEVLVSRGDIADCFPEVVRLAERPLLRTAPAPLFLLSRLVREAGIKVVLTGEGADEMFAGYDLFREGAVRRFWARRPDSELRPRLLERLYPYLLRSPVAQSAIARAFFGRDLADWDRPGFAHGTRWRTTVGLRRLVSPEMRPTGVDVEAQLLAGLPEEFAEWSPLARDQYLEVKTLLSSYLLSSQGDRMLMGNSVEGRFPYLDHNVVELANSLPDRLKLQGLNEKLVLKHVARGLMPDEIRSRSKQPYRAPDALAFIDGTRRDWVEEALAEPALARVGVFNPRAVSALWAKCKSRGGRGQFSNTDNMALVGVLSTQLLDREVLGASPPRVASSVGTVVDRLAPRTTAPMAAAHS